MADFNKMPTAGRGKKEIDGGGKKRWELCAVDGCNYRGTHSDVAGPVSYCGEHFYAFKGGDALQEWRVRDAKARIDEERMRAGGPRYLKFGKD